MSSTTPIRLNYLVFDDDYEAPGQYRSNVKINGHDINLIAINPVDYFNAETNSFDEDLFINNINEATKGLNINLIITDWNLLPSNSGFSGLVGWNIVEFVIKAKEKLKSKSFLIYSSDIKKASQFILDKITNDITSNPDNPIPSLEFVSKILNLKVKFCKRDEHRYEEISTLLKESNTISNIVLDSISNFDQNFVINTGNSQFDGKKVTDLINNPTPDNGGLKFIREFIELSIANYTELNAN